MQKLRLPLVLSALLLASASVANGAVILRYLDDEVSSGTSQPRSFQAANITGGNLGFTGYTGTVGFSGTYDNGYASGEIVDNGTLNVNEYFSFSVTIAAGYQLDLSSLTFTLGASTNTAPDGSYTTNAFVRSSLDLSTNLPIANNTAVIPAGSSAGGSFPNAQPVTVDLSSLQGLTGSITFRLYFTDAMTGTGQSYDASTRFDNLILNGDVTAVPEPASATWLALAGLPFIARRRRR
jgi:hypothetical protein